MGRTSALYKKQVWLNESGKPIGQCDELGQSSWGEFCFPHG